MKKIFCFILAAVLCFGIWGCSSGGTEKTEDVKKADDTSDIETQVELTDASALYLEAKELTDSLTSFDATMMMSVKYDVKDKTIGTESVSKVQLDRRDPESPVFYKEYDINDLALGERYITSLYYIDNVIYEKSGIGEKYMTAASVESVESSFRSVSIDLPEEIFKKAEVRGNIVSAETDVSKLSGLIEQFLGGTSTYFASPNEDRSFDFKYSDVLVGFAVRDDGYFDYISLSCSAEFDHADGHNKADITMTITYNDPGEAVDIKAPDDLSEYTWYDGENLTQEELEAQMMEEIMALFIFDNGSVTRVENYDELYIIACSKYGKDVVDMYVETIEMLGGMSN